MCFTSRSIPLLTISRLHSSKLYLEMIVAAIRLDDFTTHFGSGSDSGLVGVFCCWMILAFCFSCLLHHSLPRPACWGTLPWVPLPFPLNSTRTPQHSPTQAGARARIQYLTHFARTTRYTHTRSHTGNLRAAVVASCFNYFQIFFSFRYVLCFSL